MRRLARQPFVRYTLVAKCRARFASTTARNARIAIVGAGPSGLLLARLLQMRDINSTVFELDKDRNARSQGGSLDLHEGSAQRALKEAGLFDAFMRHARPEGETLRIFGPADDVFLDESRDPSRGRPEEMHGRPEIDRVLLRELLLGSLHLGQLRWAHKLLRVEPSATGGYALRFEDGHASGPFDCVVGADGAWSKVRPLLTTTTPQFAGVTGVDVQVSEPDTRQPHLARRVGRGMCLNLGEDRGILTQRNGDGSIRVYALMRASESWHRECGIDFARAEDAKEAFVRAHFGDWSQTAKDFVLKSDCDITPRPIYMLPIGTTWAPKPGVTLIGDAAHLMSPFAGVGVNAALEDAFQLALSMTEQPDRDLGVALRDYELAMFRRAEEYAKQSWMFLNIFFNKRGGAAMMDHFAGARGARSHTEHAEVR